MENFRCAPAVFYVGQVPFRPMKSYHWGEAFLLFPKNASRQVYRTGPPPVRYGRV